MNVKQRRGKQEVKNSMINVWGVFGTEFFFFFFWLVVCSGGGGNKGAGAV